MYEIMRPHSSKRVLSCPESKMSYRHEDVELALLVILI